MLTPTSLSFCCPPIKQGPRGSLALPNPGRVCGLQPQQEAAREPSPLGELAQTQLPSAAQPPGAPLMSPSMSLRSPPGEGAWREGERLGPEGSLAAGGAGGGHQGGKLAL